MSKGTLLIVEDEEIVAADLAQKLGRLGYQISGTTGRGEEAVSLTRELRPDLVLMDIHLAGPMDGVEAAEIIRRECDLPVIYLTAHSDRATLERAKLTEPFGYLLKPFEELDLETHIAMALYKHRAERDRLILSKLESTGIMAGGLAHDFNNLLTAMLLNLDLAQGTMPSGGEWTPFLDQARKAVLMARSLTQQLIAFAGGGAPVRRPTRVCEVIQESVRAALSGSRVRCDFFPPEGLWLAEVDEGQIGQVMRNLALNAREAMPEGGVVTIRAVNVAVARGDKVSLAPGDYVRVSVTDQGGGIAPEVLPKVFDPYFSTKQRGDQKGMGLGLTICHTVMQRHGGAITVESEAGVGTTFHLYLPAARPGVGKEKPRVPETSRWRGRILVMDDEEGVRSVVGASLARMGHEVALVEDGRRAVEVYGAAKDQGRPYDAVILDLTVRAGLGGRETLLELLRIDPGVKAIVMSGYANDPAVLEPERHGFKGVLAKPFEIGQLREILSRVLGRGMGDGG